MARPRLNESTMPFSMSFLPAFAEQIGEALGRGVARGLGLGGATAMVRRGPGRPAKNQILAGATAGAVTCSISGCQRAARAKGLCSAHYQSERRRLLLGGKK
jgi:hypothetical protein